MANFFVMCHDCAAVLGERLAGRDPTTQEYEEEVLFETAYGILASAEEIAEAMICPRCQGSNCEKTFYGYQVLSYVRGDGYLDRAGCHRDMNLYKLTGTDERGQSTDPYAEMRQPGEVDDLKVRLQRAGRHDPKTTHFVNSDNLQDAVRQSIATPDSVPS
jgi:hypothetical protein